MKSFRMASAALLFGALTVQAVTVPVAFYTFDSPQWPLGFRTPFLDVPPDDPSAIPGLSATFTSNPVDDAFVVGSFSVNPRFEGQNLSQPGGPGDTVNSLTITLSRPITSVRLDFQQFAPGHFDLTSPAGNISVSTADQAGSLYFQGASPFWSFTLAAFSTGNIPLMMGIDNLALFIVPEPSSLALCGLGILIFCRKSRGATYSR